MPGGARVVALIALLASIGVASSGEASEPPASSVRTCTQAASRGQILRDERKLIEARAVFVECAQAACPKVVRKDCAEWQTEVERRTPTMVLAARGAGGEPLADVKVSVDGQPVATKLDGRALPVDPGSRSLRFEAEGYEPVVKDVLFLEGVRSSVVEVTMTSTHPDQEPRDEVVEPAASGGRSVLPWIFAGVGAVGLGVFTALAISTNGDVRQLERACKPNCTDADVDPVRTKVTASYVALGVGVAASLTSIVLFSTSTGSQTVSLRAHPGPSFAGLELQGTL